jgi:hypothetical protein
MEAVRALVRALRHTLYLHRILGIADVAWRGPPVLDAMHTMRAVDRDERHYTGTSDEHIRRGHSYGLGTMPTPPVL